MRGENEPPMTESVAELSAMKRLQLGCGVKYFDGYITAGRDVIYR